MRNLVAEVRTQAYKHLPQQNILCRITNQTQIILLTQGMKSFNQKLYCLYRSFIFPSSSVSWPSCWSSASSSH